MNYCKTHFGVTSDHQIVCSHCLTNSSGAYIEVLDYGCRIRSICVPDSKGVLTDVCLGYSSAAEYETDDAYFGSAVGRCANLIANASFSLGGKDYLLDRNDGINHLHGGKNGFSFCLWNCEHREGKLIFRRSIPHLSDGYPGNLDVTICYEWTEDNCLTISYEAESDQDTILNMTNHTYFNLNGSASGSVMEHELWIDSDAITEAAPGLLPTGAFLPVENTPFDFCTSKPIGRDIHSENEQLFFGCGYDHNFVLNGKGFRKAAALFSPTSGIRMICFTDQPGLQIYTSNGLTERTGKNGEILTPGCAVCLETQHYADSIHRPEFPGVVVGAGERYRTKTAYQFDLLPQYGRKRG